LHHGKLLGEPEDGPPKHSQPGTRTSPIVIPDEDPGSPKGSQIWYLNSIMPESEELVANYSINH